MIVRELGIVVGKIDDDTFELVDSESAKLTGLLKDWTSNGFEVMQAQSGPLEKGQISGDVFINVKPDEEVFSALLHNQLLINGYEVQTA